MGHLALHRRAARRLVQIVAALAALAAAERRDAQAHPPPGDLVALPDGRMLHLQVSGEQHSGPTVVLETGMGGLTRLHHPATAQVGLLPEPARTHALAGQVTVANARQTRAELAAMDDAGAHVAGQGVGGRPLRILMAGAAPDETAQATVDRLNDLRGALASLSSHGEARLLPDASHVTIVTDRQDAAIVTDTILEVVEDVGDRAR